MKISFTDLLKSTFIKKDEKFRKRLMIFLICLFISIIIWFTIKLSAEYDTVVEMPVTFTQLPKNKVLTFVSDSVLQVELIEKGSNLFRMLYLDDAGPIRISLRFLPLYLKNGVYQGVVTPYLLINEIERDQNLLGKIISISPDSIYLAFETEKSRKLPVTASLDLSFEKQYMRYGQVTYEPDSVTVTGPENIMNNLDSVSLGKITLDMLNKDATGQKQFPHDSLNQYLTFSPSVVAYTIPVEKYTEAEAEIPIQINSAKGLRAKVFPDKAKVFYTIALKDFTRIEPGMLHAFVDFSTVDLEKDDRIKVSLENTPSYIRINKIEPEKVEFIIIK